MRNETKLGESFDSSYDVVVLGTGAAGLVAALAAQDQGAEVGLFEKTDRIGGSTAISSGAAWLPCNPQAAAAGIEDTVEDCVAYLMSLSHGMVDEGLARAFVESSPELVAWLEEKTSLRFRLMTHYPDYHAERPGGKPGGGRSLEPELFSYEQLGAWAGRVLPNEFEVRILLAETPLGEGDSWSIAEDVMADRVEHDVRVGGQALIGALLRDCLARGIDPVTEARAVDLIRDEGRVVGVQIEGPNGTVSVGARQAVVLATGGFEWNRELVKSFLRGPVEGVASPPSNTGDGLLMAMKAGAALGNMREAWWMPVYKIPGDEFRGSPRSIITVLERAMPKSIMVNRDGVRFTDEAANYNAQGGSLHQIDGGRFDYANLPCWIIFDEGYFRSYGFSVAQPDQDPPEWIERADTVSELATKIGVPADALQATVERFNSNVSELGRDPDFGRGDSAYDCYNGDPGLVGRERTLGTIDRSPYYAVRIYSGTLGTSGGPRTDQDGAVLDHDGSRIEGLYAVGNAMSAPTGMAYAGAGGTIGPAMVFGFRAGRRAAASRSTTTEASPPAGIAAA